MRRLCTLCSMDGREPPELLTKGCLYTVLGVLEEGLGLKPGEEGTDAFLARDILQYLDRHYRFDVTWKRSRNSSATARAGFPTCFTTISAAASPST